MDIDRELILKVAKNSRLNLSESEISQFTDDFKDILNAFSALNELETTDIKPSFHPVEIKNRLREDIPRPSVPVDLILSNSHHKKDNYFVGPKAL